MDWRSTAACTGIAPGIFLPPLPPRGDPRQALAYCRRCPALTECAESSLRSGRRHGIVAGVWLSADERPAEILRRIAVGRTRQRRCVRCWRVLRDHDTQGSCELCGFAEVPV